MRQRSRPLTRWLVALSTLMACSGAIDDSRPGNPSEDDDGEPPGSGGTAGTPGTFDPMMVGDDGLPNVRSSDGLRPLTRREYVESIDELLGLRIDASAAPLETLVAGHSKIARSQEIVRGEIEAYYKLAVGAAEAAVKTLDCKPVTDDCARAYAVAFLRRAFREAPADDTREHYLGMLAAADAGDSPEQRLTTLITTALNSPLFLYRREIGEGAKSSDPRTRNLSEYEIAERLSYLAWEAPPDAALLAAAEAGKLKNADEREAQLERLLAAPRAAAGLRGFVSDWMGLVDPESRISAKNPEVLKNTPPDLEARARASLDATVDRVLSGGEGAFLDLLDTEAYVADAAVVDLLGLGTGMTDESLRTLDTEKRRGILLHPTVLASHTGEGGASPFLMGKFVYENLLCGVLGPVPVVPAIDDADLGDKTLRQTLEEVTSSPACQTCHAKIGPPGFAFLAYDVLGRHAPNDPSGKPLDTAGTLEVGGEAISFENAPALSQALAGHTETARCVARRLFRWTFGRFESTEDGRFIDRMTSEGEKGGNAAGKLLTALVRADEFTRVRVEAP